MAFVLKGKRTPYKIVKSYKPLVVIVKGHDHPKCEDMMKVLRETKDCVISQSKYLSFDERYTEEANSFLDNLIKTAEVLVDFREVKNTKKIYYENFS